MNSSIVGGMTPVYAAAGTVRRPPQHPQRPVQPGDRLPGDAHRRAAVRRPHDGPAGRAAPAQPAAAGPPAGQRRAGDRPALAKDPEQRFASCREMIEQPAGGGADARRRARRGRRGREVEPAPASPWTGARRRCCRRRRDLGGRATAAAACGRPAGGQQTQITEHADARAQTCRRWNWTSRTIVLRPTVFLGIGGVAVRALQNAPRADRGPLRRSGRAAGLAVSAVRHRRREL